MANVNVNENKNVSSLYASAPCCDGIIVASQGRGREGLAAGHRMKLAALSQPLPAPHTKRNTAVEKLEHDYDH